MPASVFTVKTLAGVSLLDFLDDGSVTLKDAAGATLLSLDASGNLTVLGTSETTDAELLALAGLTSAADRLPYFTALGTAALATFTAAARTLVAAASASAQRDALELGTAHSPTFTGVRTDDIAEKTVGVGVTVDGLLVKDGSTHTADAVNAGFGTSDKTLVGQNGTEFVINNTDAAGKTVIKLANDVADTSFVVRSFSGAVIFEAKGDGALTIPRLVTGTVTIALGAASQATANLNQGDLTGKRVLCTLGQAAEDATAIRFWGVGQADGTVIINSNAVSTAATVVAYFVDAR